MKIVNKINEKLSFYIREKLLYIAWACFRNVLKIIIVVNCLKQTLRDIFKLYLAFSENEIESQFSIL